MRPRFLRRLVALAVGAGLVVSAGAAPALALAGPSGGCVAIGDSFTCSFGVTSAIEHWTVPAKVVSVAIQTRGGVGGSGGCGPGGPYAGFGGRGAVITGTLQVQAGDDVAVSVGAGGGGICGLSDAAAYGGGGAGDLGASGGGGTRVEINAIPVIIAGGGGGAGGSGFCGGPADPCASQQFIGGGNGGDASLIQGAGGTTGSDLAIGVHGIMHGGAGGGGATFSSGGVAGTGGIDCNLAFGTSGNPGGAGQGGDSAFLGGGGGGGRYGGGSGGDGAAPGTQCGLDSRYFAGGGGGGGGSSYLSSFATSTAVGLATRTDCGTGPNGTAMACDGDPGAVTISYTVDNLAPVVTSGPSVYMRKGGSLAGTQLPVTVTWAANDGVGPWIAGIAGFDLESSTDGGSTWSPLAHVNPNLSSYDTTVAAGASVAFRLTATDKVGNVSAPVAGPSRTYSLVQQTGGVTYVGAWSAASAANYSGGSVKYATVAGRTAKYTFSGRTIALVATKGKTMGKVKIYIGTTLVATVDLRKAATQYRTVVWSKTWATSASRTVKLVVVGTAGRPRVDLDAFVIVN